MEEEGLISCFRESSFIFYMGLLATTWVTYYIISGVMNMSLYFGPNRTDFKKYAGNGYALITGGAGGIGKACAENFAEMGIDLYLMDYNGDMLKNTVLELNQKFPNIDIKSKTIDLTSLLVEKDYEILAEELSKMEIGILFNNAGIAEYKVLKFLTNTHKEITMINAINATVPTLLCHAVLPQMIKRKRGLVMIMSSASAITPTSLLPVYGASKIYALQLSRSLQNQFPYRFSGVRFHAFHPQFIKTPMTEGKLKIQNRYIFPESSDWIIHALKTVGNSSGMSVGFFWHEFLVWLQVNALPFLQLIFANDKGGMKFDQNEILASKTD